MSAELKKCVKGFIYFLDLLWERYNFTEIIHCRISVTVFMKGAFLLLPSLSSLKKTLPE